MNGAGGRRLSGLLLVVAVAVVLASSALSLQTTERLAGSIQSVSHTQRVLEQINRLWGVLGDRDSAVLRYLLTGRGQDLRDFRATLLEMERVTAQLEALVGDNPAQRAELDELHRLHAERIRRADELIALKQRALAGDAAAGAALDREFDGSPGTGNAEAMRAVLERMAGVEKALLEQRRRDRERMIQRNRATVLAANALALAAGLAAFVAIRRWRRREDEAQRARIEAEQARRASDEKSVLLGELRDARDRMQRLARDRQLGLDRLAHDLRAHLGNVLFSADLLHEADGGEARAGLADAIRRSAHGGLLYLQAVLAQAKAAEHADPLAEFAPAEVVAAVLAALGPQAAAKGMPLQARLDESLRLRGQAGAFAHVLGNLVGNALKYAPAGSTIEIELEAAPDRACLRVLDRGPGIPADEQPLLFRRFVPLSPQPTGGETATGLGLSLARQHARAQGGDLRYEDRPGGGACFVLEWPRG